MKKKLVALPLSIAALVALPLMAQANESIGLDNGFQVRANNTQEKEIESTAGLITSSETTNPGETDPGTPTDPGTTEPESPVGRIGSFTIMCDTDNVIPAPIVSTSLATVTWDDGTTEEKLKASDTFEAKAGVEYTVTTEGVAVALNAREFSDWCLRSVNEWPEGLNTLEGAFNNERNLVSVPSYLPAEVTSLERTFADTRAFNDSSLVSWEVGNVRDMSEMFADSTFNQNISGWDVSNVEDMSDMFARDFDFNQPIGAWGNKVSNVTDMSGMFYQNNSFNYDISSWKVDNVKDMSNMFGRTVFNRDISAWSVSNVTNMDGMFASASFTQPLNSWDVSSVTSMQSMFEGSQFNHPIDSWDVSNVTDMSRMFMESHFNHDISKWNVGKVTNYANFARGSSLTAANQPVFSA